MSIVAQFLSEIQKIYSKGNATERSYYGALAELIKKAHPQADAQVEPTRCEFGMPDILACRGSNEVGYVEVKDINVDIANLKGREKEQQERYCSGINNLIYTNCLDWYFYRLGNLQGCKITVAKIGQRDRLITDQEAMEMLTKKLNEFVKTPLGTIDDPEKLARSMAGLARLLQDVLYKTLTASGKEGASLQAQYKTIKKNLVGSITPKSFADMYAQTIMYGLFIARLNHKDVPKKFDLKRAQGLIPDSSPLLAGLFKFLSSKDLGGGMSGIINEAIGMFRRCDAAKISSKFRFMTGHDDPFMHFYETFIDAYDPSIRKERGVYYTPAEIVNFIVRATDEVLEKEFEIAEGLASTARNNVGKHRVQILDPATGTGTFLSGVVKRVAEKALPSSGSKSLRKRYIDENLIPRLHGFEILMAPYAVCHAKMHMILSDLGYSYAPPPPPAQTPSA